MKDAAGNALASDRTWTFTTASGGGGTTETVTLTATADSYVSSGAAGTNFGTSVMLGVDNSPVEATYLKFDLSAYAGGRWRVQRCSCVAPGAGRWVRRTSSWSLMTAGPKRDHVQRPSGARHHHRHAGPDDDQHQLQHSTDGQRPDR